MSVEWLGHLEKIHVIKSIRTEFDLIAVNVTQTEKPTFEPQQTRIWICYIKIDW